MNSEEIVSKICLGRTIKVEYKYTSGDKRWLRKAMIQSVTCSGCEEWLRLLTSKG